MHQPTTLVGPQNTGLVSCLQHRILLLKAWLMHTETSCKSVDSFGAVSSVMPKAGVVGLTLAHQAMQSVSNAQVCVP